MSRVKMPAHPLPAMPKPAPRPSATEVTKRDYLTFCTALGILDMVLAGPDEFPNKALVAEARQWLFDASVHLTYAS